MKKTTKGKDIRKAVENEKPELVLEFNKTKEGFEARLYSNHGDWTEGDFLAAVSTYLEENFNVISLPKDMLEKVGFNVEAFFEAIVGNEGSSNMPQ